MGKRFGVTVADPRFHSHREGKAEAVALEVACLLTAQSLRAIAAHFGFTSESSVGKQRKRLAALAKDDPGLADPVQKPKRRLQTGKF